MVGWGRRASGTHGQATLEYALVLLSFVAMLAALAGVWRVAHAGRLVELARDSSSHNLEDGIGFVQDLLSY